MAEGVPRAGGGDGASDPTLESSIRRYQERLSKDPASLVFAPLADAYRKAGRTREAIATCQEGLERYPHYFTARLILVKALIADGNHEQALAELTDLVARAPDNAQCHRLLADLYRKRGKLDLAREHLERVAAMEPDDAEARATLALLKGAGPESPRRGLERLLEDDTFVTATFGTLCLQQGLVDDAAQIFARLLQKDPANREARERLEESLRMKSLRRKG
jgi:tetratricopeptide (TPR) repeat protein